MKIDSETFEVKVYAFSINVFSFVKSMQDAGHDNILLQIVLQSAKDFYDSFLDYVDEEDEIFKENILENCLNFARKSFDVLQNMKVPDEFLNEKVDLVIDVAGLIKKIENNE